MIPSIEMIFFDLLSAHACHSQMFVARLLVVRKSVRRYVTGSEINIKIHISYFLFAIFIVCRLYHQPFINTGSLFRNISHFKRTLLVNDIYRTDVRIYICLSLHICRYNNSLSAVFILEQILLAQHS